MKKEKLTPRTDLVEKRKAAGLSQAAIGEMAKLPQTYVSRFEIGKSLSDEHIAACTAVYDKLEPAPEGETKPPKAKKADKPKRKYVRKAKPAQAAAEDDDEGPDDEGYDDCMKAHPTKKNGGIPRKAKDPDTEDHPKASSFDGERLSATVRAFVSENDYTIVESGKTGRRLVMIPAEGLAEFGRIVLKAVGVNVGG